MDTTKKLGQTAPKAPRCNALTRKQYLAAIQELYVERKDAIQARLHQFAHVPPSEYFYELAYCLLTPQSKARHCDKVIRQLRENDFLRKELDPEPFLHQVNGIYVRFHKTKAERLKELRRLFPKILEHLAASGRSNWELREYLVEHVNGLGHKEATHFLRNIGRSDGLAILDRHILRNLVRCGVVRQLPRSLSPKKYYEMEKKYLKLAEKIGIPADELDLLFWSMETGEVLK
jgi:N-glycosylase/DNA lyase